MDRVWNSLFPCASNTHETLFRQLDCRSWIHQPSMKHSWNTQVSMSAVPTPSFCPLNCWCWRRCSFLATNENGGRPDLGRFLPVLDLQQRRRQQRVAEVLALIVHLSSTSNGAKTPSEKAEFASRLPTTSKPIWYASDRPSCQKIRMDGFPHVSSFQTPSDL